MSARLKARVIGLDDGDLMGPEGAAQDRFLVDGAETDGRITLVEHRLPANVLAAPLHRLADVDEFSWVIEGSVGIQIGDRQIVATPGQLVVKPRGEWHTFWNAGDRPARILEIITPGGLDKLFRILDTTADFDVERLPELAAGYGCEVDLEGTAALAERHGVSF